MDIVSLDIETTSLDAKNGQVLQLGAVAFNTTAPEFSIKASYSKYIAYDEIHGQVGAILMNIGHIKKMEELNKLRKKYENMLNLHRLTSYSDASDSKEECERIKRSKEKELAELASEFDNRLVTPGWFVENFHDWLKDYGYYIDNNGKKHLNFCGKNIYKFDIPYLITCFPEWERKIRPHYRTIDPCALFVVPSDLCPPSLGECKKRAIDICRHYDKYSKHISLFTENVAHDGLEDAVDVAKLIWFYFKLSEPVHTLLVNI